MINNKLRNKIIRITKELSAVPTGKNKHFSFIVKRSNIIAIGWNDYEKQHPLCQRHDYGVKKMHSELSAFIKFNGNISDLKKCTLINTRINRYGQFGISKPCAVCTKLIARLGFKKVYYTDFSGDFLKL